MLAKGAVINMPDRLSIGDNVYIAHDVWMNAAGTISVEDGVVISPKVVIASTRHEYRGGAVLLHVSTNAPIVIKKGSWIASNSTVTMGVTIGRGCVIGACSAVVCDVPDYALAGGTPAKVIKILYHEQDA